MFIDEKNKKVFSKTNVKQKKEKQKNYKLCNINLYTELIEIKRKIKYLINQQFSLQMKSLNQKNLKRICLKNKDLIIIS